MSVTERTLVSIDRATFGYGRTAVVSDVDLALERGAFACVLGPNGAGKTTLLRGILGLLEPLVGRVERRCGTLGYVPQRETLDPVFPVTVEEVVCMGATGRLSGLRRISREERSFARECLRRVDLVDRRRALFSSLSGGQRQRALIARALGTRPDMLVLDEPTSGVDQPTMELVLDLLAELNREQDLAIVIVSHQMSMTRTVNEVVWVSDGRVVKGAPDDMLRPERLEELFAGRPGSSGSAGEAS